MSSSIAAPLDFRRTPLHVVMRTLTHTHMRARAAALQQLRLLAHVFAADTSSVSETDVLGARAKARASTATGSAAALPRGLSHTHMHMALQHAAREYRGHTIRALECMHLFDLCMKRLPMSDPEAGTPANLTAARDFSSAARRMATDVDFLQHVPTMAAALGVPLERTVGNPLLCTQRLAHTHTLAHAQVLPRPAPRVVHQLAVMMCEQEWTLSCELARLEDPHAWWGSPQLPLDAHTIALGRAVAEESASFSLPAVMAEAQAALMFRDHCAIREENLLPDGSLPASTPVTQVLPLEDVAVLLRYTHVAQIAMAFRVEHALHQLWSVAVSDAWSLTVPSFLLQAICRGDLGSVQWRSLPPQVAQALPMPSSQTSDLLTVYADMEALLGIGLYASAVESPRVILKPPRAPSGLTVAIGINFKDVGSSLQVQGQHSKPTLTLPAEVSGASMSKPASRSPVRPSVALESRSTSTTSRFSAPKTQRETAADSALTLPRRLPEKPSVVNERAKLLASPYAKPVLPAHGRKSKSVAGLAVTTQTAITTRISQATRSVSRSMSRVAVTTPSRSVYSASVAPRSRSKSRRTPASTPAGLRRAYGFLANTAGFEPGKEEADAPPATTLSIAVDPHQRSRSPTAMTAPRADSRATVARPAVQAGNDASPSHVVSPDAPPPLSSLSTSMQSRGTVQLSTPTMGLGPIIVPAAGTPALSGTGPLSTQPLTAQYLNSLREALANPSHLLPSALGATAPGRSPGVLTTTFPITPSSAPTSWPLGSRTGPSEGFGMLGSIDSSAAAASVTEFMQRMESLKASMLARVGVRPLAAPAGAPPSS